MLERDLYHLWEVQIRWCIHDGSVCFSQWSIAWSPHLALNRDFFSNIRATSHTKDILPYTQPILGNKNPGLLEPESVVGDHLRIWSSLQASLIVRRVISDITIKSAIQAHDSNKHSSVPFLNFNSSREDLEKQAGDYEHKWLKNCAFMWLDESGTPKGYGWSMWLWIVYNINRSILVLPQLFFTTHLKSYTIKDMTGSAAQDHDDWAVGQH